ncbi:MAG: DUF4198 domain-containing protein [Caldimicrobium sp.]
MRKITGLVLAFFMFLGQVLYAHDAWMVKKDGEIIILWGHGLSKLDPYNPDWFKSVTAINAEGKAVEIKVVKQKDSVTLFPQNEVAIVGVTFDPGYRVRTTEGTKRLTKREALGKYRIIKAFRANKYSKAIFRSTPLYSEPLGLKMEIIPLKDPLVLKAGEFLPIKVLYEGKPLEGAEIHAGCVDVDSDLKNYSSTNKEGIAYVKIDRICHYVIRAGYDFPLKDDPDADVIYSTSYLSFELK